MGSNLFFIPLGGSGGGSGDLSNYYTKSQVDTLIQDFITSSVNDLVNYYTKSETYTQAEVNTLIGSIESIHFEFAASTSDVQDPQGNLIYLIGPSGTGADQYEEYVYANNQWTKIGDTSIDLSGYATTADLQNAINTAINTLTQYAVENFYQKSEVDEMLQGVQTLQGIQGVKGADGVNGTDGAQGIQGIAGQNGTNGFQGLQGTAGQNGTNGVDGLQGIQGIQGISGLNTRYEIYNLSATELGDLYDNYQTIMYTKDLYWNKYPVTSIRNYYYGELYGLLFEFNLWANLQTTGEGFIKSGAGFLYKQTSTTATWFNLTNEIYFPSKHNFETALEGKQDVLTAGANITLQTTNNTNYISAGTGTLALQFTFTDNSMQTVNVLIN